MTKKFSELTKDEQFCMYAESKVKWKKVGYNEARIVGDTSNNQPQYIHENTMVHYEPGSVFDTLFGNLSGLNLNQFRTK